jgi:hypothetical protein
MFKIQHTSIAYFAQFHKKQGLDLAKAKKWQMAIVGYRYYVTTRAIN